MKKDDAVSPVVGVMIMLTLTIILFSVVALVATSSVGDTGDTVTADVVAVQVNGSDIIFEHLSGEQFDIKDIRVVLSVREDSTETISLWGEPHLKGVSGENIGPGDRFTLAGVITAGGILFDSLLVSKGEHLTYRFYDETDRPFASGEIRI